MDRPGGKVAQQPVGQQLRRDDDQIWGFPQKVAGPGAVGYLTCGASACSSVGQMVQPCADSADNSWPAQCPQR